MRLCMSSDTTYMSKGYGWQRSQQQQDEEDLDRDDVSVERLFLIPFASISPQVDIVEDYTTHSRIDVFARTLIAAVMCSRAVRKDTTLLAMLAKPSWTNRAGWALLDSMKGTMPSSARPPKIVRIVGADIPKKRCAFVPTESWIAKRLSLVLDPSEKDEKVKENCRGWSAFEVESLRNLLIQLGLKPREQINNLPRRQAIGAPRVYVLHEDATTLMRDELQRIADKPDKLIFIVGDHRGLGPYHVNYLVEEFGALPVRVGTTGLLTSHCVTVLQHLVDERWPASVV